MHILNGFTINIIEIKFFKVVELKLFKTEILIKTLVR